MRNANRFSWWKAGAVIGVVATLVVLAFAVIPYYAVSWRVITDERDSSTTRNKTTYLENITYDPDTGLPTSVAHAGMNYMIDDDYDREFVVDAFSEYDTGTFDSVAGSPKSGLEPPAQFAVLAYVGNKSDDNKSVLSNAVFDYSLNVPVSGSDKAGNALGFGGLFGLIAVGIVAVVGAPFTGGASLGLIAIAGIGGATIGFLASGNDLKFSGTLTTDNDGWAWIQFGGNWLRDTCDYTVEVSLDAQTKVNFLAFKDETVNIKARATHLDVFGGERGVLTAYLIPGNSDTFIAKHQTTYRDEVVAPRTRSDSTWEPGSFEHDATIWAYDTSADEDYNSEASTNMGAWFGEVESHRKLKISDPLPANFAYVINSTYSGSGCSIGSGQITHLNGSDYALNWKWTTNSILPTGAISIDAQIRYSTDGWATEDAVRIGKENATMPLDIYKVRWRYTWNDVVENNINRITYDRELMPNAIYNLQAPLYTDGATNSIVSKEFISESNESDGAIPDFNWFEAIYGTNPYETQGAMNLMLADNATTYASLASVYEYSGNDLLKATWDMPVDNLTKEASYSLTLWKAPYDFKIAGPTGVQIFGESLYFELTDWLSHRSEVVDLKALLDDYFPTDGNDFQPGNEITLKDIIEQMAGKATKLEAGTNQLVAAYGATSDSDRVMEAIGMFDQMFAGMQKILSEATGIQLQTDLAKYQTLRLQAYEALDAYQMAFGSFSAYVMGLKGETQIRDEYNTLTEVWVTTIRERYQYLMKDKNLGALGAIALALSLMVSLSIIAAVHYVYVRKTKYWNRGKRGKTVVVVAYLGTAILLTYVLYAFVFISLIEYWYGVALGG